MIEHPARKHPYITTLTGVNIGPPETVEPKDIRMEDIRRSLAMCCRYRGHLDKFYSVAEHSVWVSLIAEHVGDEEAMLPGLLHDAHEAYIGDVASPQKRMIEGWDRFEDSMELVVRHALRLPPNKDPVWGRIKRYDTIILHREVRTLRSIIPSWYDRNLDILVPNAIQPIGYEWRAAEGLFRTRLQDLQFGS